MTILGDSEKVPQQASGLRPEGAWSGHIRKGRSRECVGDGEHAAACAEAYDTVWEVWGNCQRFSVTRVQT